MMSWRDALNGDANGSFPRVGLDNYDTWKKRRDEDMARFMSENATVYYTGIDGEKYLAKGIMTSKSWNPTNDTMDLEFATSGKPVKYYETDKMMSLRDEVYFKDSGQMIQAPWGLVLHYAWGYTGDLRIFTEYTEDMIWKELEEVDIIRYSEDEYNAFVEEFGEDEVEFWVISEDDKIKQVNVYEYDLINRC